ncbi:MAG: hypothetical protein OCD00_18350 [Colwellia sp.]
MAVFLLLSFTLAYQLALMLLVSAIVIVGFILSKKIDIAQTALFSFSLTKQGDCQFTGNNHLSACNYQLQPNSRISFLGCWLLLKPIEIHDDNRKNTTKIKQIFIFRDSLSEQSFSRLTSVINNIESR